MQNNGFCTVKEPVPEGKTGSFALPNGYIRKMPSVPPCL